MTLGEALVEVWRQALENGKDTVELDGERFRVNTTRGKGLRIVSFKVGSHGFDGIEQNPQTSSRWAELAREGKRIMQFSVSRRYVANVCEGKLLRYPAWKSLGLPE
ncbi:MAG: hypothetical protein DMG21_03875 [Acidobacteria bacterium]|nr:MAG: hypothetical protein DMG21_03875 [Acidobacteriota bacterium]